MINNSETNKKLIVFLHSFGWDKNENAPAIDQIKNAFPDWAYVAIDAPFPSGRERGGYAWFDIQPVTRKVVLDDGKLDYSLKFLQETIENKLKAENLSWKDLVFVGRSQGSFMGILLASRYKTPCHAVVSLGSRFVDCPQFEINSFPQILWFEMETEIVPREQLDIYKTLLSKGVNLKYLKGDKSTHDFISPETAEIVIKEIQQLNIRFRK